MVYDIIRFNKQTVEALKEGTVTDSETLGEFVAAHGYSQAFINYYIVPMGAAIWSASVDVMMEFPLKFFLRFFSNHGMLSVDDRPQWRVLSGGSRSYVEPITAAFKERIHLNTAIVSVERDDEGVELTTHSGDTHRFDQVIFACHSDQALRMIKTPTQTESEVLGALPYQMNQVVLHTDTKLMPKRSAAWAAWNYHIPQRANDCAMVTYNMNTLQNFHDAPETLLVTLNRNQEIDPKKIIDSYQYSHPVFTQDGVIAQNRHGEISGKNRTHFCGAYWFSGFHEDGVNSGLRVAEAFGLSL